MNEERERPRFADSAGDQLRRLRTEVEDGDDFIVWKWGSRHRSARRVVGHALGERERVGGQPGRVESRMAGGGGESHAELPRRHVGSQVAVRELES